MTIWHDLAFGAVTFEVLVQRVSSETNNRDGCTHDVGSDSTENQSCNEEFIQGLVFAKLVKKLPTFNGISRYVMTYMSLRHLVSLPS